MTPTKTPSRALVLVALVTATGCRSSSPVAFAEGPAVQRYAVTYRVEEGGQVAVERLVVDRPFASHLVLEGSERITALGRLATRSSGGEWTVLEIPPAPAGRDLRPDIALAAAEGRDLVERRGVKTVAGRPCRVYRAGGPVDSGSLATEGPSDRRNTEFCVGRGSIVLEQVETDDGRVTRRVRATSVVTGAPVGQLPAIPAVAPVGVAAGGGRVQPLDAATRPPFDRFYVAAPPPTGFTAAGRYAVVPIGLAGVTSLVADVYTRGADMLLIDQGASTTGKPPFDDDRPTESAAVGELGEGETALDLRANEVRVLLPDGGFLRVVGTRPLDELLAVARQLRLQPKEGQ